ncbi:unnamed protein product [Onchocerca ochengi]|uniref:Uncharacterized protein n=1 Tax=Onchocerca ochengi TaxID=42157 RepID=A0A182E235_ONCOC|nr:unnamed protein product [Onchocerca ochengi]
MSPNEANRKIPQPSSPNAKRRRNEMQKTVNSRMQPGNRPRLSQQLDNTTAKKSRPLTKPRQSLIQPKTVQKDPPGMRSEKLKKETSKDLLKTSASKSVPVTPSTTRSESLHSGLPTSSGGHSSVKARKSGKQQQPTSMIVEKQKDETFKQKRLTDAIRGFDVLAVVFGQQVQKYSEDLHEALEQNRKYESQIKALEVKYEELLVAMNDDHTRQIENGTTISEDKFIKSFTVASN